MSLLAAGKVNLLNYDHDGLVAFFAELGEKRFRATQMIKWIHQEGETDFAAMTNLSKLLRVKLEEIAEVRGPDVVMQHPSNDGTHKWLLRMDDGNCIECVFIPDRGRGTLCVSSQVGCALNCSFCATGAHGFNRDLTTAEIIGQVWAVKHRLEQDVTCVEKKITNVVMMGMGEPLLNFDSVVPALNLMLNDNAYNLSKYRVTLSTSGIIPAMQRLCEVSDVALAVSLHAPNDALRNVLVPINKKYPLKDLMQMCREYFTDKRRHITMEYVMLDGINDQPQHAKELVRLLQGVPAKVNLIPFNPFPMSQYKRSSLEAINRFRDVLIHAGVHTITRKTRGEDIAAACGQLAGDFQDRTTRRQRNINKQQLVESEAAG